MVPVLAVPGKPALVGVFESFLAGLADGVSSSFVFVVGADVADAFVEPCPVVVRPADRQLTTQRGRIADREQVRVLGLEVSVEALDPRLVLGNPGPAEVLSDGAQGHELAGGVRAHLWSVVGDREQDRAGFVLTAQIRPVVASLDALEQAFGFQSVGEGELDLGGGLLGRDHSGDPLAGHQVLDEQRAHPGAGEVGRVVDPDRVRGVVGPVRERLAHRLGGPWPGSKVPVMLVQHAPHRRR